MGPQAISALMDGLVSIAGLGCLVYYGVNRKWNKDELADKQIGFVKFIIRYRIEIIIAAVLVPQWADWLPSLFQ